MKNQLLADIFFSKGIQHSPSDLRSAWLILVTCTIAGLSCFELFGRDLLLSLPGPWFGFYWVILWSHSFHSHFDIFRVCIGLQEYLGW